MFYDNNDVRWVCFGTGSVAMATSEVYEEENGPQIEVQLCDALISHDIGARCSAESMTDYKTKVVLGFNNIKSIDALMETLKEARAKLSVYC
jgi:uncharacterized phosphosugar-binding protein